MKNLTLNLEDEIALLNKYKITSNELLFIRTLLILQEEQNEDLFKSYIESLYVCKIKLREILLSLQDKGIVLKSYKIPNEGESFDPYEIPFNKNFIKNVYKGSFEIGKELFEVYPQFGTINGNIIPLRGVSKKFDSLEQAYFRYGKNIGWSQEKHNHIIELVKWAKDINIINCSLASFIVNCGWLDLEAIKNGDKANINFETIKLI